MQATNDLRSVIAILGTSRTGGETTSTSATVAPVVAAAGKEIAQSAIVSGLRAVPAVAVRNARFGSASVPCLESLTCANAQQKVRQPSEIRIAALVRPRASRRPWVAKQPSGRGEADVA